MLNNLFQDLFVVVVSILSVVRQLYGSRGATGEGHLVGGH
jgi:hypothetical protein